MQDGSRPCTSTGCRTSSRTCFRLFATRSTTPRTRTAFPGRDVTGIAYDPNLTGFEIRSFADLWDERLAGHVGMLTEMVDTMSLTLLMLGIEPKDATLDDVARAQERLIEQRDAGIVRGYYGQGYADEMASGNTWATMAWSGDVFFYKFLGGKPDLEFVVPEEGGMLWVTPLEIPLGAQHPTDAHLFVDWFYR